MSNNRFYRPLTEPVPVRDQNWNQGEVPLVSISCVTFNHAPYIKGALEGFLKQKTTFPVEILIHDDASTDATPQIIKEYENKYKGIIYPIYQLENQYSKGISSISFAFNFPRARGSYIALCEGDDCWTDPLKLQYQIDFLQAERDYVACFTSATILNELENTTSPYMKFFEEGDVPLEEMIRIGGSIFPTATFVFRNHAINDQVLGYLLEDLPGDTSLIISAGMHGKVFYIDRPTAIYRIWPGGVYSGISQDPHLVSEWKIRRIKGYRKLQKIIGREWKKNVADKISSESLYVVLNLNRIERFVYLFNLTLADVLILIKEYIKYFIRFFIPDFKRYTSIKK